MRAIYESFSNLRYIPMPPTISRRQWLGLVLGSVACRHARGAEDPRALQFTVKNEFGSGPPANIEALLKSAAKEIWRHCPGTKFVGPGFVIYRNAKFPITHYERDKDGRMVIGLSTSDTYWAQYSFQFAHEFCHALLLHTDPRQWHKSEQANQWLDECLCETASLFTMRAMSTSWKTAPPYPNWKDYGLHLKSYADDRLGEGTRLLPKGTAFRKWFTGELSSLREHGTQREKNILIAAQLLPLFEAEPAGWESLTSMRLGTRDIGKPLPKHFAEWRSNAPRSQRAFVAKIERVFLR